jgi:hypothetical protein
MGATERQVWTEREEPLTGIFHAAQLSWGDQHALVTIRRLTPLDALIDAALVPRLNSSILLRRGRFCAEARIRWSKGGRLGLRFFSPVCPRDWLEPINPQDQFGGAPDPPFHLQARQPKPSAHRIDQGEHEIWMQHLSEDLALVKRLVEKTGEAFAADPLMMQEHMVELQFFDLTMQMLAAVCGELNEKVRGSAALGERDGIRCSCLAALKDLPT